MALSISELEGQSAELLPNREAMTSMGRALNLGSPLAGLLGRVDTMTGMGQNDDGLFTNIGK